MNLEPLQTAFIKQIISDNNETTGFLEQLIYCGKLSPARQIEIYQSNVQGALRSTLKEIYPVCLRIVGENYFTQIADQYIREHPSVCPDLNQYGSAFSDYLKTLLTKRSELADLPYLADLAKLERLHHDVYFIRDDKGFDFERFAELSALQYQVLQFKLSNALKLMKTPFPVLAIWQVDREPETIAEAIEMPDQEQTIAIFRRQFQVKVENINPQLYQFLQTLVKGEIFSELIKKFETVANFDVNHHLTELIANGWISGFEIVNV